MNAGQSDGLERDVTMNNPGRQVQPKPQLPRPNFVVYRSAKAQRTFMVVSTSSSRTGRDAPALPGEFGPTDTLDQLVAEFAAEAQRLGGKPIPVVLRVHGFNTRRWDFERDVNSESDPRQHRRGVAEDGFRPDAAYYIGFRWPSEGVFSKESFNDTFWALLSSPVVGTALILAPLLGLLSSSSVRAWFHRCLPWARFIPDGLAAARVWLAAWWATTWPAAGDLGATLLRPYRQPLSAAFLLGIGLLFLALRLATYSRDRYRALHYGVPDLGEFLRTLEERLEPPIRVKLHVVGHSMGALVLINAFRVMSDYFHGPQEIGPKSRPIGLHGTFELGTMVLCAPDIPSVMATSDNNNYFLAALRRFDALHVFSSDRDIILKWLSLLGNWVSEPHHDMAGRKLGNVLLVAAANHHLPLTPMNRPVMRNFRVYERPLPTNPPRTAALHYYDCSADPSLSGPAWYILLGTPVLFALLWLLWYFACPGVSGWLLAWAAILLGLGLLSHFLWIVTRDWPVVGSLCGMFADWIGILLFIPWGQGWNPHGGYFMFRQAPRRAISALLRSDSPATALGRTIRHQQIDLPV